MKARILSGTALAAAAISLALGGAVVTSTSAQARHYGAHKAYGKHVARHHRQSCGGRAGCPSR